MTEITGHEIGSLNETLIHLNKAVNGSNNQNHLFGTTSGMMMKRRIEHRHPESKAGAPLEGIRELSAEVHRLKNTIAPAC